MKGIEPRFYRKNMGEGRFRSFVIGYKDSDLWVGIDANSYNHKIQTFAQQRLIELRKDLEAYILVQPEFASSFSPVELEETAPEIAKQMAIAGNRANTGPMAAVAGAFAQFIGYEILKEFNPKELVIENGGDIFLKLEKDLVLSVYAGKSALSGKVGINVPADDCPMGVCTSSGTVGPSLSFGKADAVMVACKSTLLADAYATALANKVVVASHIEGQLKFVENETDILSVIIICEGSIGIRGQYPLQIIA